MVTGSGIATAHTDKKIWGKRQYGLVVERVILTSTASIVMSS